jgi:hypothetical protein
MRHWRATYTNFQTGDEMKNLSERAPKTPSEPVAASDTGSNDNTLKRVSLALLHEIASDERERGNDPYNANAGKAPANIWGRQGGRR